MAELRNWNRKFRSAVLAYAELIFLICHPEPKAKDLVVIFCQVHAEYCYYVYMLTSSSRRALPSKHIQILINPVAHRQAALIIQIEGDANLIRLAQPGDGCAYS